MNPAANVSALCRELDTTVIRYADELTVKAHAEATYKGERAKRILRARAEGVKSISEAETVADADDLIGDLRLRYLIAEGIVASTKERIASLKERVGFGRSLMASEREADRLQAVTQP